MFSVERREGGDEVSVLPEVSRLIADNDGRRRHLVIHHLGWCYEGFALEVFSYQQETLKKKEANADDRDKRPDT